MPSVDDRIVRMQFDNAEFERKVSSTIASLGQLNNALKMEGASKGLTDIGAAAESQGGHFAGLGEAVSGISAKFLALSTVAITALANITNKVIDTGIQMGKSLSMDQIVAGFSDYELKIGATQTIMAGTGEGIDTVTGHLKELDTYADKTIYNLRDMVGNISKFTNAGVKLPVATKAMIGIANAAALSGASSEEASRAMYNLGQAIGQGTVRLIDWKSVELANMGTVEFKQQLIDSAVAMGTLNKAADGTTKTLEGTDVSTKNMQYTLEENWLTAEALTATLERYGDETTEIGKKAWAAAQDVKSFSMMTETLKAGISTGWTDTFDILIGDLEESKQLFTGLTNIIGSFFGNMADARNALLGTWKDMGGRSRLIEGFYIGLQAIVNILKPIKEAFHDIFPPATAMSLLKLTVNFKELMIAMMPSEETIANIKRIFTGFFAVLEIGWTIIKQGVGFIKALFEAIGGGSGNFLGFAADIADFFTMLNEALVGGGGIVDFFDKLKAGIPPVIGFITDLKDKIFDFFAGLSGGSEATSKVGDAVSGVGDKFEGMSVIFGRVSERFNALVDFLKKVGEIIGSIASVVGGFLSDLGGKIAEAMSGGNFSKVFDAITVGLLGGIVIYLRKFFKEGLSIDLTGGFMSKIDGIFKNLNKTLGAMQAKLKAEALKEIAIAIAVLTASVLVLSLIDSAALTKALTAMSIGFGQLIGAFALIGKIDTSAASALKFAAIAVGLTILAGAIFLLALAAKSMAELSWEELARGMAGVTALLLLLSAAVESFSTVQGKMISVGIGILLIAVAINILAGAVKIFATMSWEEMAQGLLGVVIGLTAIGIAMNNMPKDLLAKGAAILLVAIALNILAVAAQTFADMPMGEIGKGFVAMAAGLILIGAAMHVFPKDMLATAAALLLVSVSLMIIAKAMQEIAEMSWGELAKGLVGMAAALLILGIAAHAMSGTIVGAIAIGIMAVSLMLLATVLKVMAEIPFKDLLMALLGIAIALTVLGVAAYALSATGAVVAMMALGAALILIGAGFALFGVGAYLVAEAFATLAKVGKEGAEGITAALEAIGKALPSLIIGFGEGILQLVELIGSFAPQIATTMGKLLGALLDVIIEYIPKVLEVIGLLVSGIIDFLIEHVPEYALMGVEILMGLLSGIRDALPEIVTLVGEIITGFLDALAEQIPDIIESVTNLFTEIWLGVAEALGELAATLLFGTGMAFFQGFLDGLIEAFGGIVSWLWERIKEIPKIFMEFFGIASPSTLMMGLGSDLINGLLNGLTTAITAVMNFFTSLVTNILTWIGDVITTLWQKGSDFIGGLLTGITEKAIEVTTWFGGLIAAVLGWIGDVASSLLQKGKDFIGGLLNGIIEKAKDVWTFYGDLIRTILEKIGNAATALKDTGFAFIKGLWDGIWEKWTTIRDWFRDIKETVLDFFKNAINWLLQIGKDIIQGLWNGIKDIWGDMTGWLGDAAEGIKDFVTNPLGLWSPSRVFMEIGQNTILGMQIGMQDQWHETTKWLGDIDVAGQLDKDLVNNMNTVLEGVWSELENISEFNPVITPVLDLTRVAAEASLIGDYIQSSQALTPAFSLDQARMIATSANAQIAATENAPVGSGEIKFEQNIYAPEQLSTADIYKQTRNQITMAKEELSIP